jgi:hypothetical protein
MAALCQPLGSAFDDNSATTSECNCSSIFERKKKFSRLVVDTNALIKGIRLDFIAEKLYTVKEVLEEVRDRNSRRLLTIHPYEFIIRHPSSVALKSVREFARQTGDLNSLSVVDLKVLALVYTLECELKGSAEHIKTMPLIEDKKDFPEVNSSAFDYKRTESYSNYKNYKKEPIQQENKLTVTAGGVIEDRNESLYNNYIDFSFPFFFIYLLSVLPIIYAQYYYDILLLYLCGGYCFAYNGNCMIATFAVQVN